MADEYEILPYGVLNDLKKQVDELKKAKKPAQDSPEIKKSMDKLSTSMEKLNEILSYAAKDMGTEMPKQQPKSDSKSEPRTSNDTSILARKLDKLIGHNEEIARGILLLLELHREHIPQISKNTANASAPAKVTFMPRQQPQPRSAPGGMFPGFERKQSSQPSESPSFTPRSMEAPGLDTQNTKSPFDDLPSLPDSKKKEKDIF